MPRFTTLHETAHVTTVGLTYTEADPPFPDPSVPRSEVREPNERLNAPVCAHLQQCRRVRVRKEGPNQGRFFFACSRPFGDPDKVSWWYDRLRGIALGGLVETVWCFCVRSLLLFLSTVRVLHVGGRVRFGDLRAAGRDAA